LQLIHSFWSMPYLEVPPYRILDFFDAAVAPPQQWHALVLVFLLAYHRDLATTRVYVVAAP
jgi:hypothetical protein